MLIRNTIHTAVFINLSDNPYWALSGASHSVIGNDHSAKLDDTEGNGNTQQTRHDSTSEGSGRGRSNRRGKKSSNSGSDSELPSKHEAVNSLT